MGLIPIRGLGTLNVQLSVVDVFAGEYSLELLRALRPYFGASSAHVGQFSAQVLFHSDGPSFVGVFACPCSR